MKSQKATGRAHGPPAWAEASARRRSTARAWWLRSRTESSWRRLACKSPASAPVRAAAARENSWRVLEALGFQAPVDSTTRGTKRTPWAAYTWLVFKCAAFTAAYWDAAERACCPACARDRCGAVTARSSAAGPPDREGRKMSAGRR